MRKQFWRNLLFTQITLCIVSQLALAGDQIIVGYAPTIVTGVTQPVWVQPAPATYYVVGTTYYVPGNVVLVPSVLQQQYYRPLPSYESSTSTWNGRSNEQFGSLSVDQRYNAVANSQCQHGPYSSSCRTLSDAQRDYRMAVEGAPLASGKLRDSAGSQRTYDHMGNPNSIAHMQMKETLVSEGNEALTFAFSKMQEMEVQLKTRREQLELERPNMSESDYAAKVVRLRQLEEKLEDLKYRGGGLMQRLTR